MEARAHHYGEPVLWNCDGSIPDQPQKLTVGEVGLRALVEVSIVQKETQELGLDAVQISQRQTHFTLVCPLSRHGESRVTLARVATPRGARNVCFFLGREEFQVTRPRGHIFCVWSFGFVPRDVLWALLRILLRTLWVFEKSDCGLVDVFDFVLSKQAIGLGWGYTIGLLLFRHGLPIVIERKLVLHEARRDLVRLFSLLIGRARKLLVACSAHRLLLLLLFSLRLRIH